MRFRSERRSNVHPFAGIIKKVPSVDQEGGLAQHLPRGRGGAVCRAGDGIISAGKQYRVCTVVFCPFGNAWKQCFMTTLP